MRHEATALREVQVRAARRYGEARWNALTREQHYVGFRNLCGNRLRQDIREPGGGRKALEEKRPH